MIGVLRTTVSRSAPLQREERPQRGEVPRRRVGMDPEEHCLEHHAHSNHRQEPSDPEGESPRAPRPPHLAEVHVPTGVVLGPRAGEPSPLQLGCRAHRDPLHWGAELEARRAQSVRAVREM